MKRIIFLAALLITFLLSTTVLAQDEEQGQASVTAHWSPYTYPTTFPENARIHIIVKGDSLWAIAQKYYNNPLAWPQLHAANPYITDNHWIYPGDPVLLPDMTIAQPGNVTDPATGESTPADQLGDDGFLTGEAGAGGDGSAGQKQLGDGTEELVNFGSNVIFETEPRQSQKYRTLVGDGGLYFAPFMTEKKLPTNVWIAGTEEDRQIEIQQYDIVYLNVGKGVVKPGEWYFCNHYDKKIFDPRTKEMLGHAYQCIGIIKVLLVAENHAVCEVLYSYDGAHLGGVLTPFEYYANPIVKIRKTMPIEEQYAEFDLTEIGYIVHIPYSGIAITANEVGIINLGKRDNLKPGDRLLCLDENVLSQMYPPLKWQKYIGKNIVARVVGEMYVVRVFEKTATVAITYAFDNMKAGNLVIPANKSSFLESEN